MSLKPSFIEPVPEETARIARAAFPKGNLYLSMHDELGIAFSDADFTDLFPRRGQPAFAPWRLVLVCVMQFLENSRIARRRAPSVHVLTGSMRSVWSSPMPGSIIQC
jgi:transposase